MDTFEKAVFLTGIRRCAFELERDATSALGSLYDLTAQRLVRYALALTRHMQDAEDALQAAMVRIAQNPQALAQARHPWAYLLKVIRNESLRIIGRRRRHMLGTEVAEVEVEESSGDDADLQARVQRALARLPAPQAEVIVLKIWEEMTFLEISDVLSESPNTIASRYRYGLEKLSQQLHEFSEIF